MKKLITLLFVGLVAFSAIETKAQVYSLVSPYGFTSDTLTLAAATGTVYLSTVAVSPAPAVTTTFYVDVDELSGTTAGTATLQGSMDGVTWKAMNTPNTATALATFTIADNDGNYHWIISGSPFPYYRVSWTATTATFSAILKVKMFRSK